MDNRVKKELDKMFLLMERMDKHYTLDESLEMEDRIEHTRDTYTDLDQFLSEVNLGKSFVGLGYVQGYEARKIYPTNPDINPTLGMSQADSIKTGFGKLDKSSRVWGKMNGLVNDPEFTSPTGRLYAGNRSMKSQHFAGIIKITNYVFNWGDTNSLSDFYDKYHKDVENARLGAGFGKNDSDYAPDDWRRNEMYKGIGASPVSTSNSPLRNSYRKKLDAKNSLYGDVETDAFGNDVDRMTTRKDGTQYQKRAFRFALKNIEKQWAKYCLVDMNGEIDEVDSTLGQVMGKNPSEFSDLRKKILPQMSQDEKNFINTIAQIDSNRALAEKTWLTDHIAYIVAGEFDPRTGTRRYVRYINPDIEIDNLNVNETELKPIVGSEIKATETAVRYVKPAAE